MKRGGEDSILFKRLCARFPRIAASFVLPDGNAIKLAAEIYAPMEETSSRNGCESAIGRATTTSSRAARAVTVMATSSRFRGSKRTVPGSPLSSRSCRCAMELASSPGWQRLARRYKALRGDARSEAKARGDDEAVRPRPFDRRFRRLAERGRGPARCRCSDHPAVTHQPALQPGRARRGVLRVLNRLRAYCCTRRSTIPIAGRNSAGTTQQNFKNTLRNSRGFAAWLGKIGSCLSRQRVTSW